MKYLDYLRLSLCLRARLRVDLVRGVGRQLVESFVIKGKAKTVFKLVEMLAKAEKTERKGKKK